MRTRAGVANTAVEGITAMEERSRFVDDDAVYSSRSAYTGLMRQARINGGVAASSAVAASSTAAAPIVHGSLAETPNRMPSTRDASAAAASAPIAMPAATALNEVPNSV